jgi:hypothetical protein
VATARRAQTVRNEARTTVKNQHSTGTQMKKLTLKQATLRRLTPSQLRLAAGGAGWHEWIHDTERPANEYRT